MQAAHVETAKISGECVHSAAVLMDLSNFYEHTQRPQLQERASQLAFPPCLVPLLINMYSARRYFSFNGIAHKGGFPRRGIPAGCSFATFLVQLICYTPVANWQSRFPRVLGGIFIDDLMLRTLADSHRQIVVNIVPAVKAMRAVISYQ